jgi:hypothetical protein
MENKKHIKIIILMEYPNGVFYKTFYHNENEFNFTEVQLRIIEAKFGAIMDEAVNVSIKEVEYGK